MTFEEYSDKINHAVLNQDEIPVVMQEILSELKQDLTALDSFKTKTEEQENKIKGLQESNIKLFLGQATKPEEKKEEIDIEDMSGIGAVDAYLKNNNINFNEESEEKK